MNKKSLPFILDEKYEGSQKVAENFPYAREISRPWAGLDNVLEWCKSELINDWRWSLLEVSSDHQPGRYLFYFDSARDCCAFSLKWC